VFITNGSFRFIYRHLATLIRQFSSNPALISQGFLKDGKLQQYNNLPKTSSSFSKGIKPSLYLRLKAERRDEKGSQVGGDYLKLNFNTGQSLFSSACIAFISAYELLKSEIVSAMVLVIPKCYLSLSY
jgi:hypothetical protein